MNKLLWIICILGLTNLTKAQDFITYGDTIRFENDYSNILIDTSQANVWQIGAPQKVLFHEAYSPSKAMVTDTLNPYPTNNLSYFQLMVTQLNLPFPMFPMSIFLEFQHKIDTDSLRDGGYVTVSYDHGLTWENVISSNPPFFGFYMNTNIYTQNDSLINGMSGFSGTDTTWKTSTIGWPLMGVKSNAQYDTILFRFNFVSDSIQTNKEGWMIDNIRLYAVFYSGIHETNQTSQMAFPNPCQDKISFSSAGLSGACHVAIYHANGSLVYQDTFDAADGSYLLNSAQLADGIYQSVLTTDRKQLPAQRFVVHH